MTPERLAEIEAWLLNVVGRTAGSYREDIAELLAEVKRLQEAAAVSVLLDNELQSEEQRSAGLEAKAQLADELATRLRATIGRFHTCRYNCPCHSDLALLDRYDATKEPAK